jgi:protein-S-isoprenylcysteine O-methyltransferase Ste14
MRGNPFLDFQRAAEARGYPALLIVSMLCLGLVVASVALLALTPAAWVLALALLSVIVALAILAGAMEASFSDRDEPASGGAGLPAGAPEDREAVVPLPRPQPTTRQTGPDRKAA